jgi:hypothetical protein
MKNFLISLFSDESGEVSSKRIAGMLCIIALVISLITNTRPSDTLVSTLGLFAFGSFGLTSIDKFIKNRK